jgi:hypothetical protein
MHAARRGNAVLGCPYEGAVRPEKIGELSAALLKLGCYEVKARPVPHSAGRTNG